jgi:hypothetical protein
LTAERSFESGMAMRVDFESPGLVSGIFAF